MRRRGIVPTEWVAQRDGRLSVEILFAGSANHMEHLNEIITLLVGNRQDGNRQDCQRVSTGS